MFVVSFNKYVQYDETGSQYPEKKVFAFNGKTTINELKKWYEEKMNYSEKDIFRPMKTIEITEVD